MKRANLKGLDLQKFGNDVMDKHGDLNADSDFKLWKAAKFKPEDIKNAAIRKQYLKYLEDHEDD